MIIMNDKSTEVINPKFKIHVHDCRSTIGDEIRKIREKKGYSQEHLAHMMKISRTTISKIENGKFNFSIDYLSKFSWFLDFNITISPFNDESY